MAPRLIHNRPGPVGCENARYRYATSQQHAGPEKGECAQSRTELFVATSARCVDAQCGAGTMPTLPSTRIRAKRLGNGRICKILANMRDLQRQ
jgi:hypothetical protein